MLLSSVSMIFGSVKERDAGSEMNGKEILTLIFYGLFVGLITGLIGAGGGFLIVPALVFFAKIPVKAAVGTSLLIIAINSLTGFAGDLMGDYLIDWKLLFVFLGFAIAGIFLGSYLTKYISGKSIKKSFGWFVLFMGVYIIIREINSF